MPYTNSQIKAYESYGHNVLVSAGAGSGKTKVLSKRVGYLIEKYHLHIEDFLILTFTKLAAKEMKNRIKDQLSDNKIEQEKVDNAYICTFDSFSSSLIKKYHALLNLDPQINMVDNNDLTIKIKMIIDDIFDEYYLNRDNIFISFIQKYAFKKDDDLKQLLENLYQKKKKSADERLFLEKIQRVQDLNFLNNVLNEANNEINDSLTSLSCSILDIANQSLRAKLHKKLKSCFDAETLDEKNLAIKDFSFRGITNNNLDDDDIEIKEKIKLEINSLKETYGKLNEKEIKDELPNQKKFNSLLLKMLEELETRIEKYKAKNHLYTFDDIAKLGIKLLKENEEVRLTLKNKFKTIMIDEYQDTSEIQETFVSLIASNNVYQVGDIKQSIYRFRNASPETFSKKFELYQNLKDGELITLENNFRSRKELLSDFNQIFKKIMTSDLGGANYQKDHIIKEDEKIDYTNNKMNEHNYHSEIIYYSKAKYLKKHLDNIEIEANLIADDIIEKINSHFMVFDSELEQMRPCRLNDFCLLADRGTGFYKYKKVFKERSLPIYFENNDDIKDEDVVLIFASLLKMVRAIFKKDEQSEEFLHAYLSLGRSYLFSLDDEALYYSVKNKNFENVLDKIKKILNESTYYSIYELIIILIDKLGFYSLLPSKGDVANNEAYIDYFLNTIKSLYQADYTLDDYINYFEKIDKYSLKLEVASLSNNLETVTMMNIFKSKGLEFKIVYLTGLEKEFNKQEFKNNFYINENVGIIYPSNTLEQSYLFSRLVKKQKLESLSEKIRIYYVALTRAGEQAYLLISQEAKEKYQNKKRSLDEAESLSDFVLATEDDFLSSIRDIDFNKRYYQKIPNESKKELNYRELTIINEIFSKQRFSKELSFTSNEEMLKIGEKLHFYLEITDFIHPNYDIIDKKYVNIVKRFINSPLIKNLKNPIFYKEYQFDDNGMGIIDCLIIDGDNAYIIDYKLKRLDDENYRLQVNKYASYVKKHFNKNVTSYLYSILDGTYLEVKE